MYFASNIQAHDVIRFMDELLNHNNNYTDQPSFVISGKFNYLIVLSLYFVFLNLVLFPTRNNAFLVPVLINCLTMFFV